MLELHFSGDLRRFTVSLLWFCSDLITPRTDRGTSALDLIWQGSSSVSRRSNRFHSDRSKFYILANLFSRSRGQLIAIVRNRGGFE